MKGKTCNLYQNWQLNRGRILNFFSFSISFVYLFLAEVVYYPYNIIFDVKALRFWFSFYVLIKGSQRLGFELSRSSRNFRELLLAISNIDKKAQQEDSAEDFLRISSGFAKLPFIIIEDGLTKTLQYLIFATRL